MIHSFPIESREAWLEWRKHDVTASVAAALFGGHPYMTAYQLWAHKSGLVAESNEDSPEMRRGRDLEPIVLKMVGEKYPDWLITPGRQYYRDPDARLGATPDALVWRNANETHAILQVKTAGEWAFRKGWKGEDGGVEVPLWIALQSLLEAHLTGACAAVVAVLDMAAWEVHVADVPLKPALMAKLRELVADFWRRVAEGDAYPADYARDGELIARIYADADGPEVDLAGDNRILELVERRSALKASEADGALAAKERKIIDAELIHKLGNAARGRLPDGRMICAPTTRRAGYTVKDTTFRVVTIKDGARR